jgi:predicted dehydrogenase
MNRILISKRRRKAMSTKLCIGLIGTSGWTEFFYLDNLNGYKQVHLAAICGRNHLRTKEVAAKYGIERVYNDYKEMLASGELDVAIVVTPEDLHYPMVMAALDADLHVICEKPLAFSATEAQEMYDRAKAAGLKHLIQFTNRWIPGYRYIKDLLDSGYIGRPYQALFNWIVDWNLPRDNYLWYFDSRHAHGVVSEMGAHVIDLARWYFGEIVRVHANFRSFVPVLTQDGQWVSGENDTATLILDFENDAQGVIHMSNVSASAPKLGNIARMTTLIGDQGSLLATVDPWTSTEDIIGVRTGSESTEILPVPDEYYGETDRSDLWQIFRQESLGPRAFINAILDDRPVTPSFYDGWQTQRVIEAALKSAKIGCAVNIDDSL